MKYNNKLAYQIIDTESELKDFANALENEETVAVDLEADSMYHFKEKVCLLQIAAKQTNIIIDPLQIKDLSPLQPIFFRHDIRENLSRGRL